MDPHDPRHGIQVHRSVVSSEPPPAAATQASPASPLTLVVGDLALPKGDWLAGAVDARRTQPSEALERIEADSPELVLLDGRLPGKDLSSVLECVGHPDRPDRPAVIVVTEEGRRTHVESHLIDHADDFVNGALGTEVLVARIRTALRVRGVLGELARKNAELETVSQRLEKLAGRMAEELRLASRFQRALLPPPLHHPHLELAAEFIPVREIGGDYYDVIPLAGGRLAVTLADVMGKGVPAALLAANLKACLRAPRPCRSRSRPGRAHHSRQQHFLGRHAEGSVRHAPLRDLRLRGGDAELRQRRARAGGPRRPGGPNRAARCRGHCAWPLRRIEVHHRSHPHRARRSPRSLQRRPRRSKLAVRRALRRRPAARDRGAGLR